MKTTNTSFDTYNAILSKHPIYTVEIEGKTDRYCNQRPKELIDDEAGTSWGPSYHGLCLADGVAFLRIQGLDLTTYAGKDYKIALKDASNNLATGYIDEADVAEALGSELASNTGFETAGGGDPDFFANWTENVTAGGTIEDEGVIVNGGSHAAKLSCGAGNDQFAHVSQAIVTEAGKLYKLAFYTRGDGTAAGRYILYDGVNSEYIASFITTGITGTSYTLVTVYFTAPSTQTVVYVCSPLTASGVAYFDDISVKEVTHVGTDGVHIVSTRGGSTRNWAEIETGFDYNASSYRLQVTDGLSIKKYLVSISGLSQSVTPEEGKATIGAINLSLLDYDQEITRLIANDTYQLQRKKVTIKAGYVGMVEEDLLTIYIGWITDIRLSKGNTGYDISVTDPQRWMQRKIFRGAEASPVSIQGNALNIVLAVLTSTGAGTNGDYDWYTEESGLGLDESYINIASVEKLRDDWFPGDSAYVKFTIKKREVAKTWLEREIYSVFNLYPVFDGDGRFNLKVMKPPLPGMVDVQSFDEDNIIGIPQIDMGFSKWTINEAEFFYDYDPDDEEFDTDLYYIDSTSVTNRGPGRQVLTIKSQGLQTSFGRAVDIITKRRNQIFQRFSNPPIDISFETFFSRWPSEAGDVVPFTHAKVPDLERGRMGLTAKRMEIVNRSVDWKSGKIKIQLVNTGFAKNPYFSISPTLRVIKTTETGDKEFKVSLSDTTKTQVGWHLQALDSGGRIKISDVSVTAISGNSITVSPAIGSSPKIGWMFNFAKYQYCTNEQREYGFFSDARGYLTSATTNHISNGQFENQTPDIVDAFNSWINFDGDGRLSGDTVSVHSGTTSARIIAETAMNTYMRQSFSSVTPGSYMRLSFYARGDGSYPGRYKVYDNKNAADIVVRKSTGVTGKAYAGVTEEFKVPVGCDSVGIYLYCPKNSGSSAIYDDVLVTEVDPTYLIVA